MRPAHLLAAFLDVACGRRYANNSEPVVTSLSGRPDALYNMDKVEVTCWAYPIIRSLSAGGTAPPRKSVKLCSHAHEHRQSNTRDQAYSAFLYLPWIQYGYF